MSLSEVKIAASYQDEAFQDFLDSAQFALDSQA
jgi:hypothetical protein